MVSKYRLIHYIALRVLFNQNIRRKFTFDELVDHAKLEPRRLITVLSSLKSWGSIRKRKIKGKMSYWITNGGKKKLAYYEMRWNCYKYWKPPWYKQRYYDSINKIIRENNYFGLH